MAVAIMASDSARGRPPLWPTSRAHSPLSRQACIQLYTDLSLTSSSSAVSWTRLAAVKQQQSQTAGTKNRREDVLRDKLLQGLLLRFAQFNNAFHGQVIGLARPSDNRIVKFVYPSKYLKAKRAWLSPSVVDSTWFDSGHCVAKLKPQGRVRPTRCFCKHRVLRSIGEKRR